MLGEEVEGEVQKDTPDRVRPRFRVHTASDEASNLRTVYISLYGIDATVTNGE